jgi:hypothetical protein
MFPFFQVEGHLTVNECNGRCVNRFFGLRGGTLSWFADKEDSLSSPGGKLDLAYVRDLYSEVLAGDLTFVM